MIIAVPLPEVDVVRVDRLADGARRGKIKGRKCNAAEPADRNHRGIRGRDLIAVDLQYIVENAAVALAVEIEVGVVRQIDRRLFIRHRMIENTELSVFKNICHAYVEFPGVVFFTVGRSQVETKLVPHDLVIPDLFVEADLAAVQVIAAVVAVKLILHAVDRQLALSDAVAESSDERTQIPAVIFISGDVVIPEDHIRRRAVLGGYDDALDDPPEVEYGRLPLAVDEIKCEHLAPVLRCSENPLCDHRPFLLARGRSRICAPHSFLLYHAAEKK